MQQLSLIEPPLMVDHDHLSIQYLPSFLSAKDARALLKQLIDSTDWQQPRLKVYAKWYPTPRLVRFIADHNVQYLYANVRQKASPWTPILFALKQRVEQFSRVRYNSVLLNYYRDGQDTMGWHADDEKELGSQPNIASLSLGATRDIHFKQKNNRAELIKLSLHDGSLFIMDGNTQEHWLHHVPKRLRCKASRLNLTFRYIHPQTS